MSHEQDIRFDAVLPSHLIFNENLVPEAKLFYAVVRNLCNKYGYCWASNEYLSSLMQKDERTIRRWLKSLYKEKYLEVTYGKPSENTERKIYVVEGFKKRIPRTKLSNPPDKIVPHKEDSLKEDTNCLVEEPISSPPSDINKFITKHGMQGQKIECSFLAVIQHGINEKLNWVLPEIEEAWNVLAKYKDGINNYIGFIVSTINNLKKKSKSNFNTKGKTKCKATATVVPLTEETKCGSYKPRFLGDALRELASQHLT